MATLPTYNAPAFKSLGAYNAPTWDEDKIDAITQKRAAPGLRELRNQVQRVTGRTYGSPQVTKMTLRDALQGYGAGLDRVMAGASAGAQSEYGQKYGFDVGNAKAQYGAGAANATAYNAWAEDAAKTSYGGAMTGYENESRSELSEQEAAQAKDLVKYKYDLEYDDDWKAKMEKEYELWRGKYDYMRNPIAPPEPIRTNPWKPLGRA